MKFENKITNERFYYLLKDYIKKNGYTPTMRELGYHVGLSSPSTIKYHLDKLEKLGKIKKINKRYIKIIEDGSEK